MTRTNSLLRLPRMRPVRLRADRPRSLLLTTWLVALLIPTAAAFGATPDVSGVYAGHVRIDGLRVQVGLVLHQRQARGRILGTVLGGGEALFIENAVADGAGNVTFDIVLGSDRLNWSGRLTNAGALQGSAGPGQASRFTPVSEQLDERQLVFALVSSSGEPTGPASVALALDAAGELVGGSFSTDEGCGLFGCRGAVTRFSEAADTLDMAVAVGGACSGRATVQATFDHATLLYSGTARVRDCNGSRTLSIIGARGSRSNSTHAAAILEALGVLADDLERNQPFGSVHPSFAADYHDTGRTLAMVLGGFNAEQARYSNIQADFDRVRGLFTIVDPTALPDLVRERHVGALFDEFRTGVPTGSTDRKVIVNSARRPGLNLLEAWAPQADAWVIRGDQLPALDLPFNYTVVGNALEVPTPGGTIYASHGPFGAHFFPHTGDPAGESKANLVGFFTASDADMTELIGDGDGLREPGELWGYDGGLAGENIRNRRPVYTAPLPGTLVWMRYSEGPTIYFDGEPHWELEVAFSDQVRIRFGHVGKISSVLRDRILAATGIDTDTYAGPPADILTDGAIPVAAGEALAYPQVLADPLPAPFDRYYVGGGSFLERPWAQMEFPVIGAAGSYGKTQVCIYEMMLPAATALLQTALDLEMADPSSQRYRPFADERWKWASEGRLCNGFSPLPDDFEELGTRLGGWYERMEAGTTPDELVSFVHIAKETAAYDPALYEPNVDYLIVRLRANAFPYTWPLPGGGTVDVVVPTGEILSLTDTTFLVKWREVPGATPVLYQWASYLLNDRGLNVAWGDILAAPGDGIAPPLTDSTPCNDTTVLCYDHEGGIPGL